MTTRSDIANEELTKDPIFLLQERLIVPTDTDRYEYDSDTEVLKNFDGNIVTLEDMLDNGDATECWNTESVWLTRPEAETHASSKAHHYPHGSRVYCVPACGALAALLNNTDKVSGKAVARAEAAETEVARLKEALRSITERFEEVCTYYGDEWAEKHDWNIIADTKKIAST